MLRFSIGVLASRTAGLIESIPQRTARGGSWTCICRCSNTSVGSRTCSWRGMLESTAFATASLGTTPNLSPGYMTGHRLTSQSVPRQQAPDHGLQNRASDGEAEMVVAQKRDWLKRALRGAEPIVVRRQSTSAWPESLPVSSAVIDINHSGKREHRARRGRL